MLSQTISSELLSDLSTDEQQLLAGGFGRYSRGCGYNGGGSVGGVGSTESSTPAQLPIRKRMVVGHIITVTPFAMCLNGETGTNGGGTSTENGD